MINNRIFQKNKLDIIFSQITGNKEPYLNFLRELVIQMFSKYGTMPQRTRFSSGPTNGLRYDGLNHWIVSTESNSQGKSSRRNCKHCTNEEVGQQDNSQVREVHGPIASALLQGLPRELKWFLYSYMYNNRAYFKTVPSKISRVNRAYSLPKSVNLVWILSDWFCF